MALSFQHYVWSLREIIQLHPDVFYKELQHGGIGGGVGDGGIGGVADDGIGGVGVGDGGGGGGSMGYSGGGLWHWRW